MAREAELTALPVAAFPPSDAYDIVLEANEYTKVIGLFLI